MAEETQDADLTWESVDCALCGSNDYEVRYEIPPSRMSDVWIDGVNCSVSEPGIIVTCRHCGLTYVNPRLATNSALTTYSTEEELAYFSDTRASRSAAYGKLIEDAATWLGRDSQTWLDIGCGDGALVGIARRAGIECVGTEISHTLIRAVQQRLGEDAIVASSLADLPRGFYDVVTLLNVLEHLPDPRATLKRASPLLKPDGLLLVHVPNLGGLPARLLRAHWRHIAPTEHLYYFTPRTLRALMSRADLEPLGRFSLATSTGLLGTMQHFLESLGFYWGNGLGVVARSAPQAK